MTILVFDIETIPDIEGLKKLGYGGEDADDREAIEAYQLEKQRESTFLPLHLHKIVAISCVLRHQERFRVWSLGTPDEPEEVLIQRFYDGIHNYKPQLISWNGGGFDLPVLHYRSLIHGLSASQYWEMGDSQTDYRYNNYINRYHFRHIDLMDLLALYQPRACAPLDEMAKLCGFPGKLGMDGSAVYDAYCAGEIKAIRDYCETDVVNTYLIFLNFQLLRGKISNNEYRYEIDQVVETLQQSSEAHWAEYLSAWEK